MRLVTGFTRMVTSVNPYVFKKNTNHVLLGMKSLSFTLMFFNFLIKL